jgi:hypothetical protein
MVVLGLVDSISTQTVRSAPKKTRMARRAGGTLAPTPRDSWSGRGGSVAAFVAIPVVLPIRLANLASSTRSLATTTTLPPGAVGSPDSRSPVPSPSPPIRAMPKGVRCRLMMCVPLRGWRHVTVIERRTRRDYAHCIREMVDQHFPRATKIRLAQDSLNTPTTGRASTRHSRRQTRRGYWIRSSSITPPSTAVG